MAVRPDIEGIEKRLRAVTGRTWTFQRYQHCGEHDCFAGDVSAGIEYPYIALDVMAPDAEFIVSARNSDVRDLIAWIRHLEANAGVAGQEIPT